MGLLDGVAVLVAGEARVGDVVLTGFVLNVDDGRGDRRCELAIYDAVHGKADPLNGHFADARHREGVASTVGGHRRRTLASSVHPRRDFVARPVLVGTPEVEAGGDGLGGVEIARDGRLGRHHRGSGPHGLVPRGAEGVEGEVVRGARPVEDSYLHLEGDVGGDEDGLAGVADGLLVDHHLAGLRDVLEHRVHHEFCLFGLARGVVGVAGLAARVLVGPGGLVAGVAGRVAGAADEGEAEEGQEGAGH